MAISTHPKTSVIGLKNRLNRTTSGRDKSETRVLSDPSRAPATPDGGADRRVGLGRIPSVRDDHDADEDVRPPQHLGHRADRAGQDVHDWDEKHRRGYQHGYREPGWPCP